MILAILQARTSSTRLPHKVLKPILGLPMLLRQVERIRRSSALTRLVIATSREASDDPIEKLCLENGVNCFRGSLNDVLDRFYQTAKQFPSDHIVRLTGDCPLADPELIDRIISFYLEGNYDYASNTVEPTFPDGLDVEVLRLNCLEAAWQEAQLPSEREHVTPFIFKQPQRFKIGSFKNNRDLSGLRWTVDEPLDFELVQAVYEALYPSNPNFSTQEILNFLNQREDLKRLNRQFKRNEGYRKSLARDTQA